MSVALPEPPALSPGGPSDAPPSSRPPAPRHRLLVPLGLGAGALVVAALVVGLVWRADARVNHVAMASTPKGVTVQAARAASYRASRTYVGTVEPWVAASVGPQLVSAYVDTVLVRPGAVVKKGEVVATLDCKSAGAASQAVAAQARAIEAQQKAQASEAARYQGLLEGGFTSRNEAEMRTARSAAEAAQLQAARAQLAGRTLEVNDCVLRAPFDGEVAARMIDPGAFVRPGQAIVKLVDRRVVRLTGDAPEVDFDVVAPGAKASVRIVSTRQELTATIARRAPAADPSTRTVSFELDLDDPERRMPVGTTAELRLDVGEPVAASEIPLSAATIRGAKATVFVVDGDVAHKKTIAVRGERGGSLFLDAGALPPGARVVTEGRALLNDGDRVASQVDPGRPAAPASASARPAEVKP